MQFNFKMQINFFISYIVCYVTYLVKSILLVQISFIKRCSCLLVIQSLSVPECRRDLVSNLVSFLFFAVFSYCCIFLVFL